MKKLIPALALLFISATAAAEAVYTIDSVDFTFRTKLGTRSKMIVIPGGTELTLLNRNSSTGFSKVRTSGGVEGYIVSRSLTTKPGMTEQSDEPNSKLTELPEENTGLKTELTASKKDNQPTLNANKSTANEVDRVKQELVALKIASSQTQQLKAQRDQLQERNIAIEQELNQLKRENQSRQKTFNKDWLLYGGGLALAGVLLGILLPKMGSRRRYGGWE